MESSPILLRPAQDTAIPLCSVSLLYALPAHAAVSVIEPSQNHSACDGVTLPQHAVSLCLRHALISSHPQHHPKKVEDSMISILRWGGPHSSALLRYFVVIILF
ncbi:hypothetical protein H1C71_041790 [Ictidomys tridecemlineatus]|nr:hypothetical protein H1C71_041790 [Ictidomys tridecemlineatus]